MEIRKVPATAGADWLLSAFNLLRKSPFGLGLLGLIYGLISLAVTLLARAMPNLLGPLQLALMVVGPLLMAGMVFAAREVDEGRSAAPGHLLRGIQEGKAGRLLGTLLPQIAALLVCAALLVMMIGIDQLQALSELMQKLQTQTNPDPAMFEDLPVGRLFLWLMLVMAVGVLSWFFTFTALPDMMFADAGMITAMRRSFRACLGNLPAMILFFVMFVVVMMALGVGINVLGLIFAIVGGELALVIVSTLLMGTVLLPLISAVMYFAWKQMVGTGAPSAAAITGIEV